MQANAQSLAQKEAVASLPAQLATGAPGVSITVAEALALGFTDLGDAGTSFANPADLNLEADNGDNYLYSTNPDQVPNDDQSSLLTTMEHEISEGMGRVSSLDLPATMRRSICSGFPRRTRTIPIRAIARSRPFPPHPIFRSTTV